MKNHPDFYPAVHLFSWHSLISHTQLRSCQGLSCHLFWRAEPMEQVEKLRHLCRSGILLSLKALTGSLSLLLSLLSATNACLVQLWIYSLCNFSLLLGIEPRYHACRQEVDHWVTHLAPFIILDKVLLSSPGWLVIFLHQPLEYLGLQVWTLICPSQFILWHIWRGRGG